jgi:hypothetical protein
VTCPVIGKHKGEVAIRKNIVVLGTNDLFRRLLVVEHFLGSQMARVVDTMEHWTDTEIFHMSPSLQYAENQDGAVLVDFDHDLRVTINPMGAIIFKRLKARESIAQIAKALAEELAMPQQQIRADVSAFITDLKAKKVLVSPGELPKPSGRTGEFARNRPGLEWLHRLLFWVRGI